MRGRRETETELSAASRVAVWIKSSGISKAVSTSSVQEEMSSAGSTRRASSPVREGGRD